MLASSLFWLPETSAKSHRENEKSGRFLKFRPQVAIIATRCYILDMETVNPIVFNCNDLTLRRVHKVLGQSSTIPDVLKAMRDEKELYRKRRLKILPFTVEEYEKTHWKVDLEGAYGVGINPYLCDSYIYPLPRRRGFAIF